MANLSPEDFQRIGEPIVRRSSMNTFAEVFMYSPVFCAHVCMSFGLDGLDFLHALMFLNLYLPWSVLSAYAGLEESTYTRLVWAMIETLCTKVPVVIQWARRSMLNNGNECNVIVNITTFPVSKSPKNYMFISHKAGAAGILKYEFAANIRTGHIVWLSDSYPGFASALGIFRQGLKANLSPGEKVEAGSDDYFGDDRVRPVDANNVDEVNSNRILRLRLRYTFEAVKRFGCLGQPWRQHLHLHHQVVKACVLLTQLAFQTSEAQLVRAHYGD